MADLERQAAMAPRLYRALRDYFYAVHPGSVVPAAEAVRRVLAEYEATGGARDA